jgi:hypothetical protein
MGQDHYRHKQQRMGCHFGITMKKLFTLLSVLFTAATLYAVPPFVRGPGTTNDPSAWTNVVRDVTAVFTTNTVYRRTTNSFTLSGATGTPSANGSWFLTATGYTNSNGETGVYFDSDFWFMTNSSGTQLYFCPAEFFPGVSQIGGAGWDAVEGTSPVPFGGFDYVSTPLTVLRPPVDGGYSAIFSNGVETVYLNAGLSNYNRVQDFFLGPNAFAAAIGCEMGTNSGYSAILASKYCTNGNGGVGNLIAASNDSIDRSAGGENVMLGCEFSVQDNKAGVGTMISCFQVTNNFYSFGLTAASVQSRNGFGRNTDAENNSVMLAADHVDASAAISIVGGKYSTITNLHQGLAFGVSNIVHSAIGMTLLGQSLIADNCTNSVLIGHGMSLTNANKVVKIGIDDTYLLITATNILAYTNGVLKTVW